MLFICLHWWRTDSRPGWHFDSYAFPSVINNACTNYRYGIFWLSIRRWYNYSIRIRLPPSSHTHQGSHDLGIECISFICHHSTDINHRTSSRTVQTTTSTRYNHNNSPHSSKGCCNYPTLLVTQKLMDSYHDQHHRRRRVPSLTSIHIPATSVLVPRVSWWW